MMHLPALTMTGNIGRVTQSVASVGIAVRGLYGEGTEADGCLYQISNQITMGLTEKEIIEKVRTAVDKLSEMEKQARSVLEKSHKLEIEDKVCRSYGILKYARSITSAEAKTLLSDVMLGQNMGIIKCDGDMTPIELMVKTAPSVIAGGKELAPGERDKARADLIRANI